MDVGVGEVAGAHGHEVAVRAEVWLEVGDHVAVLADGEAIFTSPPSRTSDCIVIS